MAIIPFFIRLFPFILQNLDSGVECGKLDTPSLKSPSVASIFVIPHFVSIVYNYALHLSR
jgi:hypothetical protein